MKQQGSAKSKAISENQITINRNECFTLTVAFLNVDVFADNVDQRSDFTERAVWSSIYTVRFTENYEKTYGNQEFVII